jgi:zinc transport system permease protein
VSEFFAALGRHTFLQQALLAGVIASVACGVIGSYVVVRRITYLAGGVAHCTLGGIGAAEYLRQVHGVGWMHPLLGAALAAVAAALLIGWISLRANQREDTVISALWAVGMAAGVLLLARTPGYQTDPMNYLFGNILLVSKRELYILLGLDAVVLAIGLAFYNRFLAVCFDGEFAELRGISTRFYYLLLLALTALTVVVLVTVVGLIMVIALLTLPVAIAGHFVHRLWHIMVLATLLSVLLTGGGLALSYAPGLPAGPVTIALAGLLYLVVLAGVHLRARLMQNASTARGSD